MDARWYVVHAYSGFEKKVAQSIREQADREGIGHDIDEVLVPTEEVVEIKRGARATSERKFFPGYVLVKMKMTDHAWHLVKNTPKVTGFLGAGQRPSPISEAEARRIVDQAQDSVDSPKPSVMFEIGDADRRAKVLATLGGIEETIFITVGDEKIMGVPEIDVDRTNADGKASSVQFVHFPFTDSQVIAFSAGEADVSVGFSHDSYAHTAGMPAAVRAAPEPDAPTPVAPPTQ